MKRGKLIVFEGISGTGKETQAKLLRQYLAKKKINAHIVFHPSPHIKNVLRAATSVADQITILAEDRESVVRSVIAPALARGEWVISLRNYISAYVYQGDGKPVENIDRKPDGVFYFDIEPAVALKRIVSRGETRGTYETLKLLREKRKKYKEVLSHISHITLNAEKSIDEIHQQVVKCIL